MGSYMEREAFYENSQAVSHGLRNEITASGLNYVSSLHKSFHHYC